MLRRFLVNFWIRNSHESLTQQSLISQEKSLFQFLGSLGNGSGSAACHPLKAARAECFNKLISDSNTRQILTANKGTALYTQMKNHSPKSDFSP